MLELTQKARTNIALNLYDFARLIGPRITYRAWRQQFRRGISDRSARRTWDRRQREFQALGIAFRMSEIDGGSERKAMVFESTRWMLAEVDRLIGLPEFYQRNPNRHMQKRINTWRLTSKNCTGRVST